MALPKIIYELSKGIESSEQVLNASIGAIPSNVIESQFSDVRVKGNTWTNKIRETTNSSILSSTANARVTINTSGQIIVGTTNVKTYEFIQGHKYFFKLKLKGSSVGRLYDYVRVQVSTALTVKGTIAGSVLESYALWTATETFKDGYFYAVTSDTAGQLDLDYAFVYDLTEIFGAGNEPNEATAYQTLHYVNNTKSTFSVKTTINNENLFDEIWESGWINTSDGVDNNGLPDRRRTKLFYIPDNSLRLFNEIASSTFNVYYYDVNKNYISYQGFGLNANTHTALTKPANARYARLGSATAPVTTGKAMVYIGTNNLNYIQRAKTEAYTPADWNGKSLPNGTKDEFSIVDGVYTQRVSDDVILDGNLGWSTFDETATNTYRIQINGWTSDKNILCEQNDTGKAISDDGDYLIKSTASLALNDTRMLSFYNSGVLYCKVEKAKIDAMPSGGTLAGFKEYLNQYPITLSYQLATPDVTQVAPPQTLICHPSGTVYIEPVVKEHPQIYNNGIFISNTDYPIVSIDKIWKYDDTTGKYIEDDIAKATIAGNKLSITISDAVNGQDRYILAYYYDQSLTTLPSVHYKYNMNIRATKDIVEQTNELQQQTIENLTVTSNQLQERYDDMGELAPITEEMDNDDLALKEKINEILAVWAN